MPVIPLKHVVSFSSEDQKFPADNLLKPETYRKWKCKENGEKQISVILQFEKSYKIYSVDVGNENSAFIEILVGSSSDVNQDFKVLLPTSSFMSPSESKSTKNSNRVRMFDSDKLSKPVLTSKWDMVKIVCTQPFNKYIQYGISFITFHSPPERSDVTNVPKGIQSGLKLGAFTLKPDDNQVPAASPGSLFLKRKLDPSTSPTGAATIRKSSNEIKTKDMSYTADTTDSAKCENISPKFKTSVKQSPITAQTSKQQQSNNKNDVKPVERSLSTSAETGTSAKKRKLTDASKEKLHKKKSKDSSKPNKLMNKVVFVLSGFQNPQRGEIRDKALEMGASYCADWNSSSTHLICAFKNTPKYNLVRDKGGRIVNKDWIEDCHKKKTLLPWRTYSLGSNSHVPSSPESLDSEESVTDEEKYSQVRETSDAEDTDDEIRRVQEECKEKPTRPDTTNIPLPELPDIFIDKSFYLFGKFSESTRKNVKRLILSFGGDIEDYMSENVCFVITESKWDSNFDDALACNSEVKFVKPIWISKCSQENKFVPFEGFTITS